MTDAATDNSLDKIRDLLFGPKIGDVDEQLASARQQIAALQSALNQLDTRFSDELHEAVRSMRAEVDKRADELTQALGEEIRHRLAEHPTRTELAALLTEVAERLRQA